MSSVVTKQNNKKEDFAITKKNWNCQIFFFYVSNKSLSIFVWSCRVIALIGSGIGKFERKIEHVLNFSLNFSRKQQEKSVKTLTFHTIFSRRLNFPRFSLIFSLEKLLFSLSCCYRASGCAITLKTWCWASRNSAAQPDGSLHCFLQQLKISANKKTLNQIVKKKHETLKKALVVFRMRRFDWFSCKINVYSA